MSLAHALSAHTTSSTRARGADYFQAGAIVHFDPHGSMVYAVVRGSDDYVVRLEAAGRQIRGTCTCPYFSDRLQPCKHLWAVALECDERRELQLAETPGAPPIAFVPVPLGDDPGDEAWPVDDPEFQTPHRQPASQPVARGHGASWRQALAAIESETRDAGEPLDTDPGRLLYVVDLALSQQAGALTVHLMRQEQKQTGDWGVPRPARIDSARLTGVPDEDRTIVERLAGARPAYSASWNETGLPITSPMYLRGTVARDLLPLMCATGRCRFAMTVPSGRPQSAPLADLTFDNGTPLQPALRIARDEDGGAYVIEGMLEGDRVVPLASVRLLLPDGIGLTDDRAFRFDANAILPWMRQLHARGPLRVPIEQGDRLRAALIATGTADAEGLPEELRARIIDAVPAPSLVLRADEWDRRYMEAEVAFSYSGGPVVPATSSTLAPTADPHVMSRRSTESERAALERLRALGVRTAWDRWDRRQRLQLPVAEAPRVVRALVPDGWRVEVDGHRYRPATATPEMEVRSGIDWFELHGDASFDDQRVALPQLLEAIERRNGAVALPDGTFGIVPDEWLRGLAPLAVAARDAGHLRFTGPQMALVDALLDQRPAVTWDEAAAAARDRLRRVDTIAPERPPASFRGELRSYQQEALGWLAFLRRSGFGGCLADDMGLGKTVVVLALLEARRHARDEEGRAPHPSLVVVPRSVLYNWQQEAARFAPGLRVLDFSGADRRARMHRIAESDLVLVTYGTLRRDAPALVDREFDYIVLDEAQTIKNANTAGAKAARLLRGRHRLALSGTPVENRLADLWSLFEFLNPGLLSGSTAFSRAFSASADAEQLNMLGRGLRPFILRRTKEQVASELPERTEQTLICELERPQRLLYDELRDHYRRQLLGGRMAWERSKLQVLEALLRLRQAACHPGLVDARRASDSSAKLDLLVPRIVETIEEGHKALVFSQFTSFLSLLRTRLDREGLTYEYLDGRTRDRAAHIDRFQTDPACPLFLISLKAGGVGLNLTAADYVFILDPWWNPAAEAQAIDRTHRIGQTRNVFAYRLIARDTVEERVLELQQRKRELADAIITADNSVIRGLQREDLELLLS